jgi:hypothetical protein
MELHLNAYHENYEVPNAKNASVNSVYRVTEQIACSHLYLQDENLYGVKVKVL